MQKRHTKFATLFLELLVALLIIGAMTLASTSSDDTTTPSPRTNLIY